MIDTRYNYCCNHHDRGYSRCSSCRRSVLYESSSVAWHISQSWLTLYVTFGVYLDPVGNRLELEKLKERERERETHKSICTCILYIYIYVCISKGSNLVPSWVVYYNP